MHVGCSIKGVTGVSLHTCKDCHYHQTARKAWVFAHSSSCDHVGLGHWHGGCDGLWWSEFDRGFNAPILSDPRYTVPNFLETVYHSKLRRGRGRRS